MNDQKMHRMTIAALVVVAFVAAFVSFIHIYSFAVDHHQLAVAAGLYPFSIDALIAVVTVTMFRGAYRDGHVPGIARATLALAVLATLSANFGYGLPYGLVAAAISCWPAVAFVCAIEVAVKMIRKPVAPKKIEPSNGHPPITKTETVSRVRRAKPAKKGRIVITRQMAEEMAARRSVSVRTVRNHPEWFQEEALN